MDAFWTFQQLILDSDLDYRSSQQRPQRLCLYNVMEMSFMHLAAFAKSGCNHCKLVQHLVPEPRGRDESICGHLYTCTVGFLLWRAALSLPEAAACRVFTAQMECHQCRNSHVGTWLQLCFRDHPKYSNTIMPYTACNVLSPYWENKWYFWEEMLGRTFKQWGCGQNGGVQVLTFAFCPQPLSRMWHEEGVPIKANSRGRCWARKYNLDVFYCLLGGFLETL